MGSGNYERMDSDDNVVHVSCDCYGRDVDRLNYLNEQEFKTKPKAKKRIDGRIAIKKAIKTCEQRLIRGEFPFAKR